jgi:hypothetical protein
MKMDTGGFWSEDCLSFGIYQPICDVLDTPATNFWSVQLEKIVKKTPNQPSFSY